ncbi:MAG: hypothetical protein KJ915_06630 [Candidatus Omnitrophica bacterium]|nr:hypothetical protein [Candidatus Omnitrophota bacterium]
MRNFKQNLLFVILGIVLFCSTVFAVIDDQQEQEIGKAAVNQVFSAYSNYSLGGFDAVVSDGFMPLRSEFMNRVDVSAINQQTVEFNVSIDQVLVSEQKMSVMCKWYKKFTVSGIPGQQKNQGSSELIFKLEDEQWKLISISGDNPF